MSTTCGIRFPQNASAVEQGDSQHPAGLYDGAAGIGLVLLRWAQLDSSPHHRALAQSVVDGLLESTRSSPNNPSLYGGDAGVAVLLLRAAQVWKDAVLRDHAHDIALALSDAAWTMPDLLFGPAGTGLALLAVHGATRDPALLRGVRCCVARLAETAVRQPVGVAWRLYADRDEKPDDGAMLTGFAHGAAGIIGFLSEAARAMPADRRARALLQDAGAWLDAQCRALPRGRAAWPRSSTDPTLRHHWCHGTQGIALGYLWRYAHTRSPAHLVRAVSAGLHAWDAVATDDGSRPGELACHCHGLAGALDTFRALATATGDPHWHQRGRAIVGRLERLAGPGHEPSALGGDGCGFSTGTAGVVAALMADAGRPVVPPWSLSGLRDLRALTRHRPARRSRRDVGRLSGLVMANPEALVPSLAAPLEARATIAFLPRSRRTIGAREAARLLRRAESAPVHVAGHEIEAGTARLFRDFRDQLSSHDVFDADALLRRVVGLSWSRGGGSGNDHLRDVAGFLARRLVRAIARCLSCVRADRDGVLRGLVAGPLTEVTALDNDPHHGGQQVLRLRFADGPVILYKPRDVRLDWFMVGANRWSGAESAASRMNRWMGTSRRGGGVPVHGIYPVNETHGYAEWLESCDDALVERARPSRYADRRFGNLDRPRGLRLRSEAEARAFWRSAGAMASQLALLGVSDQHVENLLVARAAGAPRALLHPVDCEVAFVVGNGLGVTQLVPDRADQVGVHGATDHTHFGFDVRPSVICSLGAEDWALRRDARGALHMVDPPADIADRWQRHVVRNPDGSFGCTPYLGAILRGVVDHWDAVRAHRDELAGAAARLLRGAAYRVLAKTTAAYGIQLRRREMGCRLWPGAASMRALADGRAFHPSEFAQLDLLDVPKYERFVGGRRTIWRPDDSGRDVPAEKAIAAIPTWTSVSGAMHRHGAPGALANALFDVIAFGAPSGAFDLEDEKHGVRVRRASDTAPLELIVARATAVARFRLDADNRLFFSGLRD